MSTYFPSQIGQALAVVTRPQDHPEPSDRRMNAWAILKGQRGERIVQHRLRRMAGLSMPARPATEDDAA